MFTYYWKYKEHNTTRTIDDSNKYRFAKLLYHELAHANNFIPPNLIGELNSSKTIYFITSANYKNDKILSKRLYKDIALFVVNFILPTETDWDEFFAKDVGELKLLEAGKNWWDSRIIGDIKTDEQRKRVKIPNIREINFNEKD